MLDSGAFQALQSLQAEVAAMSTMVAGAARAAERPVEGHDGSRTVRVTLDPAGAPRHIDVAAGWLGTVGVDGLAAAVRDAWQDAALGRLRAFSSALSADPEPAAAVPPPSALPPDAAPGDLGGYQVQSNLTGLLSLLGEAENAIRDLAAAGPLTATGTDPYQRITATVQDGALAGLQADTRWLRSAPAGAIGPTVLDAVTDALTTLRRREADRRPAVLREVEQLTANPADLLRAVGLLA